MKEFEQFLGALVALRFGLIAIERDVPETFGDYVLLFDGTSLFVYHKVHDGIELSVYKKEDYERWRKILNSFDFPQ